MNQPVDGDRKRSKRDVTDPTLEAREAPFEDQLAELDTIVAALEEGKLPLDDALALYERGVRLAQACQRRLDEAELRVRRLRVVRGDDATPDGGGQEFFTETLDLEDA